MTILAHSMAKRPPKTEPPKQTVPAELVDEDEERDEDAEPEAEALADEPAADLVLPDEDAGDDDDVLVAKEKAIQPVRRGSLAARDPLQRYIDEIRRYPLLTREQEHELAAKYVKDGDVEAARQ